MESVQTTTSCRAKQPQLIETRVSPTKNSRITGAACKNLITGFDPSKIERSLTRRRISKNKQKHHRFQQGRLHNNG